MTNQHHGWLLKRKRKRLQGFAKRYFFVDEQGVLSYAFSPNEPIRDSVKLPECSISHSRHRRAIIIDSGTVVMHCKALNEHDFDTWLEVLRSFIADKVQSPRRHSPTDMRRTPTHRRSTSIQESTTYSHIDAVDKSINEIRLLYDHMMTERENNAKHENYDHKTKFSARVFKKADKDKEKDKADDYSLDSEWIKKLGVALSRLETHWEMISSGGQLQRRTSQSTERPLQYEPISPAFTTRSSSDLSDITFYDALANEADLDQIDDDDIAQSEAGKTDTDDECQLSTVDESDMSAVSSDVESIDGHLRQATTASTEPFVISRRNRLPCTTINNDTGVFSILKKNMGKNLSQVSIPVTFNEPLSALQRLAEDFDYASLLTRANSSTESIDRLSFVAAFIVSGFSCTKLRSFKKPFNPLLGETFECVRPDKGFKFIAEKVQHHPPVLACWAGSSEWEIEMSQTGHSKFWGRSLEYITEGTTKLRLKKTGEVFTWDKPSTFVRNIMSGSKYLEHVGTVTLSNITTGEKAILDFKGGTTWGGADARNKVHGKLLSSDGSSVAAELMGRWDKSLSRKWNKDDMQLLWECNDMPESAEDYYGFTKFAIELNELTPDLVGKLAATDSRLRPDQKALEEGDVDRAEDLKKLLEEAQRARRRANTTSDPTDLQQQASSSSSSSVMSSSQTFPRFFECVGRLDDESDPVSSTEVVPSNTQLDYAGRWRYKGDYFKKRDMGTFPAVVDIFAV